ncbi:putative disease resistance protein RGA1 [Iris pallida]|uniref:Disease resistance protein RGA1 n=1 Tax=Iris pallida TaxID=29817 RepID=A0AAX6HCD1_IRIPA|nr:putative disease resistance protein RGA1 [Iris pallida]
MHDLLHDLAEDVSKDYCFRIEDGRQHIPANVMHLSVVGYKNKSSHLRDIFKLVNLRTLIIVDYRFIEQDDISGFVQQVFMKFKKLRMLHLGSRHGKVIKLDKSVGGLKHLRYLQIEVAVEELPESLGKLYHLQFLVIKISIKKQFGIGQLKNLQQLRGTLSICNLENVKDKAEASEASLREKKHVDTLELHWERRSSEQRDGSMDEEVLEGLQPHPNLGALKLDGYNGVRLPKWRRNDGSLSSDLYFIDLERLHSLEIVACRNLQQIPSLPRMLGRLVIAGCANLSEVPLLPLGLRVLKVHGCPKLVQLQPVSSRIEELDLEDCGDGVETMLSNMSENGSSSSSSQGVGFVVLRRLRIVRWSYIHHGGENEKELCLDKLLMGASLTHLELIGLPWLTSLLLGPNLTALTHLELIGLPWLTSLLLGPNLTALERVTIERCENLRSIGNSLVSSSSLKYLSIWDCPRLTVQQQQQQADDHWGGGVIGELDVEGCPELTWLWNLNCFTSVRELRVKGCPKLTLIKSGGGGGGGGGDDSLSPMPPSSSSSSPLESVTIDDLSLLTAALLLPPCRRRESLYRLNSLWILTIEGSTTEEEDKPLTAELEELFQHHLTSLTRLWFQFCWGLPSLPANLENLPSLRELYILDCPKIESLPNLPASLREVYIRGCHPRLKEKYRNDHSLRGINFTWR